MTRERRVTRQVRAGTLGIGSSFPVSVQTMWADPLTHDSLPGVCSTMETLRDIGCSLMRFSVPDEDHVQLVGNIASRGIMAVAADIHYDYRLALQSLDAGVQKVRINPGNIGAVWKTREIITRAADAGAAIRVGVNSGSLPLKYRDRSPVHEAMVSCVLEYVDLFEQMQFPNLVVSLKSSDPEVTCQANRAFASLSPWPLHIGVTEAGPLIPAVVKSTHALSQLLSEGIGDTVRVSISGDITSEVIAAKEILRTLGFWDRGISLISCPKCARASFDTHAFFDDFGIELERMDCRASVAVMGCAVNGLEEARHADLGITGAGKRIIIFSKGKVVREVSREEALEAFREELKRLCPKS